MEVAAALLCMGREAGSRGAAAGACAAAVAMAASVAVAGGAGCENA